MTHDISNPISQRSDGTKDSKNRGIQEIADAIERGCRIYEAKLPKSKTTGGRCEVEYIVAEILANDRGIWFDYEKLFLLGIPGPSGNENDTYVSEDCIYKVNNLMNTGSISGLFRKIILHNNIFPETSYEFFGFTGFPGRSIFPILKQSLIQKAVPATKIEIDTYMSAIGFTKMSDKGKYARENILVWDVLPRNVLKDAEGDIYVIDAEIKQD